MLFPKRKFTAKQRRELIEHLLTDHASQLDDNDRAILSECYVANRLSESLQISLNAIKRRVLPTKPRE